MNINTDEVVQKTVDSISSTIRNLKKLNIVVAGKTGVGKSTLINSVFRDKLAETGIGKPVTDHMRKITKKGVPLTIYDTRGFELGKEVQNQVKQEISDTISRGLATHDINQAIHCIWYCINTTSNRIEPEEIEWLRALSQDNQITQVPIIVVLTQAISSKNAQAMKNMILDQNLDIVQVVDVLAEDYEIHEGYSIPSYGLDRLIQIMGEALPDELIDTLQHVQIACLAEKKKKAHAAVATATAAAMGVSAAPIPLADCAILIPTQMGMIATITTIFGIDVSKSMLAAILSSTLGAGGTTFLGKTVVANLAKLIPGAGSVAGAAISSATAGVLTAALGEVYIQIMTMIYNGELNIEDLKTREGKAMVNSLLKKELSGR